MPLHEFDTWLLKIKQGFARCLPVPVIRERYAVFHVTQKKIHDVSISKPFTNVY